MKATTSRQLPLPDTNCFTEESYKTLLVRLADYDTMMLDINSDAQKVIEKKKERLVLEYIATFHPHTVSKLGGNGRFKGYWQTYVGKGRGNTALKRSQTLEGLLAILADYYGVSILPPSKKSSQPTLKSYFPHWLEWKGRYNNNKTLTLHHNEVDFQKLVADTPLGEIPIDRITTEDLDTWARALLIRKPMSAKRFNTYKIVVTGPLELAVREKLIPFSPWKPELQDYRRLFKTARRAPSKDKIFYDDEIAAINDACLKDYDLTHNSSDIAILVNWDLALRVGELSCIMWEDVDIKGNLLSIRRQESEGKVEEYVKSDSAAGYRELPLNKHILALFHRLRKDTGNLSGYIFVDEKGKRKTASAISNRFVYVQRGKDYSKKVKRIHCQRRTAGTKIAKDCGLEAARQWLGHQDLQTTLRYIYSTETMDSLREYSENTSALAHLDLQMKHKEPVNSAASPKSIVG